MLIPSMALVMYDENAYQISGERMMKAWMLLVMSASCCMAQVLMHQETAEQKLDSDKAVTPIAATNYPLDTFRDFSAIQVGSLLPTDNQEFHIYRSGNLLRTEAPQSKVFFVTDLSTFESWAVSARGCFHSAQPYYRAGLFTSIRPGFGVEGVAAGQETADGRSFKVEDVTISPPKPARQLRLKFFEAEDLQGFPAKIEILRLTGGNRLIRFKNVVLGPQDPTLFIHSKSCDSFGSFQLPTMPEVPPGTKAPAVPSENSPKK